MRYRTDVRLLPVEMGETQLTSTVKQMKAAFRRRESSSCSACFRRTFWQLQCRFFSSKSDQRLHTVVTPRKVRKADVVDVSSDKDNLADMTTGVAGPFSPAGASRSFLLRSSSPQCSETSSTPSPSRFGSLPLHRRGASERCSSSRHLIGEPFSSSLSSRSPCCPPACLSSTPLLCAPSALSFCLSRCFSSLAAPRLPAALPAPRAGSPDTGSGLRRLGVRLFQFSSASAASARVRDVRWTPTQTVCASTSRASSPDRGAWLRSRPKGWWLFNSENLSCCYPFDMPLRFLSSVPPVNPSSLPGDCHEERVSEKESEKESEERIPEERIPEERIPEERIPEEHLAPAPPHRADQCSHDSDAFPVYRQSASGPGESSEEAEETLRTAELASEEPRPRPPRRRLVNVVNRVQTNDVLNGLEVTGFDWEGRGVVRLFVRAWSQTFSFNFFRALPGERLTLRVDRTKSREGRKLTVSPLGTCKPSEDERHPPCRHFDRHCGGCSFLHLNYKAQLRAKMALLASAASKETVADSQLQGVLRPIVPSPNDLMYRNRSDFLFLLRNGPQLGHFRFDSPQVVDIPQCPKLVPAARRVYKALRERLLPLLQANREITIFDRLSGLGLLKGLTIRSAVDREGVERVLLGFECSQTVTGLEPLLRLSHSLLEDCGPALAGVVAVPMTSPGREPSEADQVVLAGAEHIVQSLGDLGDIQISVRTSFPTNALLLERFCSEVLAAAALQPHHVVWDFFSGCGLFSLLLGKRCRKVFAFDNRAANLVELENNLSRNGVENVDGYLADLSSRFTFRALSKRIPSQSDVGECHEEGNLSDSEISATCQEVGAFPQRIPGLYDEKEETRRRQQHLNRVAREALKLLENEGLQSPDEERGHNSADVSVRHSERRALHEDMSNQGRGKEMEQRDHVDEDNDKVEFDGLEPPDVLVLQPPRLGCDKALRRWLRRTTIPRIVYVSRHPPCMFRDIGALTYLGYRLDAVQPIDMFPHSALVMCVASLTYVGRPRNLLPELGDS
ncbi:TrmA family RNA methyltransferase [Toxoplasma gondii RUB]|uniref:TrmA family RNA methyltransferase n=1 Tax=Toxoplasma gondii RUB TaxID=935652 RepID=A0A086M6F1_TOXGO|nr:TrmA family RNA methyltransferase [Toxoplasma gondii RUB]